MHGFIKLVERTKQSFKSIKITQKDNPANALFLFNESISSYVHSTFSRHDRLVLYKHVISLK